MQVEVTNVSATNKRIGQTDLSVQVGTIQVNLTAILVNDVTGLLHAILEHAKS